METLDKHFRSMTAAVFQKHGFAQGEVLSHWRQIVGQKVADMAVPERIRWPRGGETQQSGVLVLKVKQGCVLDVQYASPSILGKVNGFLGYQAVDSIKTVLSQGFAEPPAKTVEAVQPSPAISAAVAHISEPDLQAALARLGAGVAASQRSPQAK